MPKENNNDSFGLLHKPNIQVCDSFDSMYSEKLYINYQFIIFAIIGSYDLCMKRFICVLLLSFISFWKCAIMEQSIEDSKERLLPANPVFYSASDSVKLFNAKSAIQRSPEHLLSSYVVVEDGVFHLDITKEEMDSIGVSDKDYQKFLKTMSGIKPNN